MKGNTILSLSIICTFTLIGCSTVKKIAVDRDASQILKQSDLFSSQFTGFSLLDPTTNEILASHNATLKFTPASNTKLLTMYVALRTFADSIPSLAYYRDKDATLHIMPMADGTFLYAPFEHQPMHAFLANEKKIHIHWPQKDVEPFGPGWAWDDYIYRFQPEVSSFPIYGNTVRIRKRADILSVEPPFFENYVEVLDQQKPGELVDREQKFNIFKAYIESDTSNFERVIPFSYSKDLFTRLLSDTLGIDITTSMQPMVATDTLFSHPTDTVLAYMLKPSDNFLAEHLLLQSAKANGYSETEPFIKEVKTTWLPTLTDMVWVDGSGLSRYNLISPIDQVRLLKICLDEFGWERVTNLLPSGGEGTLENRFLAEEPYIFAKTGTLSNNHNISGYLVTRAGKRLIFSFMSNHYTRPTAEVKKAMEDFLLEIRNAY